MPSKDALLFLVDTIDLFFKDYFDSKEDSLELPLGWKTFEYEAETYYMRGELTNKKLDSMADEWLAKGKSKN